MKRRNFITLLGGTAVAGPLRAFAQTLAKVYRVGLLGPGGLTAGPFEVALIRGLAKHGYVPDGNLALDRRGAGGHPESLPQLVAEFVASKVEVIIALGYQPVLARIGWGVLGEVFSRVISDFLFHQSIVLMKGDSIAKETLKKSENAPMARCKSLIFLDPESTKWNFSVFP